VFKKPWTSEFKKKAKCARSSESLPTGLRCNQYNPEIRRQIRDTDSGQVPRLLETKNNRELMKKFLLALSAAVAVLLPLSQNAQAHWVVYRKVYVYHHVYHRCWHHGYWSGGFWHPGCWF
jgi:hypothetical protein